MIFETNIPILPMCRRAIVKIQLYVQLKYKYVTRSDTNRILGGMIRKKNTLKLEIAKLLVNMKKQCLKIVYPGIFTVNIYF